MQYCFKNSKDQLWISKNCWILQAKLPFCLNVVSASPNIVHSRCSFIEIFFFFFCLSIISETGIWVYPYFLNMYFIFSNNYPWKYHPSAEWINVAEVIPVHIDNVTLFQVFVIPTISSIVDPETLSMLTICGC